MNYNVVLQNIAWFNNQRQAGTLVLSPRWQRRAVWLDRERSSLIETVFSNLPFPEVYLQRIPATAEAPEQLVVVDGQQRLTSIFKFIDGEASLPDNPEWEGRRYRDLTEAERHSFLNYEIVVRQLYTASDAEIRDLFVRLNTNNFSLNDQELRNARFSGRFKCASERLADNPFFQSIRLFTPKEIRRMEDIEFVSELLLLVVEGITNKKDLLDAIYAQYDEEFPREAEFEEEFNGAMQLLMTLVTPGNATLLKTKSNFYSCFGACLRYWRQNQRPQFNNLAAARTEITQLLQQAKSFDPEHADGVPAPVQQYYDAVSRAASDRSRRVRREEILWGILTDK